MIENFAANDKFIEDKLQNNIDELSQLCKFQSVSPKNIQLLETSARTDPADPFVKLVAESATSVYGMPMMIVPMVGGSGTNHLFIENL
jgi:hypothetical protein